MYLAMSRLKVISSREIEFEIAWKSRLKDTDGVKGFKRFNLIKGSVNTEYSLYVFYSEWNSENDFISWTESSLFKLAYKNPTWGKNLYLGPPDFDGYLELPTFEGFKVVI